MIIKIKGTNKKKTIDPSKWSDLVKLGKDKEYEIIERNTVLAVPIDKNGNIIGEKREFDRKHWERMLELGSKLRWRSVDKYGSFETNLESNNNYNNKTAVKSSDSSISELQVKLIEAQISESHAKTKLAIEKIKYIKWTIISFLLGIVLGHIPEILKLLLKLLHTNIK